VPLENLADRAKAYGIDSYIVDGNNVVAVYTTAKEAVERARAGEGPILIETKTFRRLGHAQHDPAEYVPKEMRAHWEARDPIALYEKFLTAEKFLDGGVKREIEEKLEKLLAAEREFAEKSPMPPPELAETGVYCTGDDCHKIRAKWERPISEVTPPKSSVKAVWTVPGFGSGEGSGGADAPIHFGDTAPATKALVVEPSGGRPAKTTAKSKNKAAAKKAVKAVPASASRKARR